MVETTSLAKIRRPLSHNILLRERLFDRLKSKPVVWIAGPPGSGKTTLVSSYIESKSLEALWYQVDSGDKDIAGFFHYMSQAAKNATPRRRKPLPKYSTEFKDNLAPFGRRFFQGLFERIKAPSVIVFDNYQDAMGDSDLHCVLQAAIEEIPTGINIIIISHNEPTGAFANYEGELVNTLNREELKLTNEESREIVLLRDVGDISGEAIDSINEKTDGWVVGLVLMVEKVMAGLQTEDFYDGSAPDILFDYFIREVFNKQDIETKDFLMMTSIFTSMTEDMAAKLTGNVEAGRILKGLYNKNCFTSKLPQRGFTSFQYHYLFRGFLLNRLKESFPAIHFQNIARRGARLLKGQGLTNDAFELYKGGGDWEEMVDLILGEAQTLLKQGRNRQLIHWIESLPESFSEERPWLVYWKGGALQALEPVESLVCFEEAYKFFCEAGDSKGVVLSICGAINSTFMWFGGHKKLDKWIDIFFDFKGIHPDFLTFDIEPQVTLSIFYALASRRPDHEEFDEWLERGKRVILEGTGEPGLRVLFGGYLLAYYMWMGKFDTVERLIELLKEIMSTQPATPLQEIRFLSTKQLYYHNLGDEEACVEVGEKALALSREYGIHMWNHQLYGASGLSVASAGRLEEAGPYLDRMQESVEEVGYKSDLHMTLYYCCRGWLAFLKGELSLSERYLEKSFRHVLEMEGTWFEALTRLCYFHLLIEMGRREESIEHLDRGRLLARRMKSGLFEFMCLVAETRLAMDAGDEEEAEIKLRAAFALGSRNRYMGFCYWHRELMSTLSGMALARGIETGYARELIKRRELVPSGGSMLLEEWPWSLKIYTMGHFEIIKDDVPIKFMKKTPKKPLEMLKLLVALGGADVSSERICDILWPDSDGDTANRSFITTLNRLRKLMGIEGAIRYSNGRVGINTACCWVDLFTLEALVDGAESQPGKACVESLDKALRLCRGGLSAMQPDEWVVDKRNHIKDKLLRVFKKAGKHCEDSGDLRKAIEYYRQGLSMNCLFEAFCHRTLICYQALGLGEDAISFYQDYVKSLYSSEGITPSSMLRDLYESIVASTAGGDSVETG